MRAKLRSIFGNRIYVYGTAAGLAMFVAIYIVDAVLVRIHLRPEVTALNDLLLGALAGILVVSLELQHQREMRRQRERLATVLELNHHIRNALQSIVCVTDHLTGESADTVRQATRRIDWALREILPADERPSTNPRAAASAPSSQG